MAEKTELEKEMAVFKVRDRLGPVIERARYYDTSTFLLNRGQRVAAVVPKELAELADALGGPARAAEILRGHLESQG